MKRKMRHTRAVILSIGILCSIIGGFLPVASGLTYGLVYTAQYSQPNRGAPLTIFNSFTNNGTVDERVTSLTITSDLGTFTPPAYALPLPVPIGQEVKLNMTVNIPANVSAAGYAATATVDVQYYNPNTFQWVTPPNSPLIVEGVINIPLTPAAFLARVILTGVIIAGVAGAATLVTMLLLRRRKEKPTRVSDSRSAAPPTMIPPTRMSKLGLERLGP